MKNNKILLIFIINKKKFKLKILIKKVEKVYYNKDLLHLLKKILTIQYKI